MDNKPFIRYYINSPYAYWWKEYANPYLTKKGWHLIEPTQFSISASYGFDPRYQRVLPGEKIADDDYCLQKSSIIVEYCGEPVFDSIFDSNTTKTVVDDLLAFMSLYSGVYCQYYWIESRTSSKGWNASLELMVGNNGGVYSWAGPVEKSIEYFERALVSTPAINSDQFGLAFRWFFSAFKELEIGRPILETALNWVCLESQANVLGITGNKRDMVSELLTRQRFQNIPLLGHFYRLRNDAFHEGQLSNLSGPEAQTARIAGRALVRASILKMLGMDHTEFNVGFTSLYI